ncbi:MAG: hypothetical protein AAF492_11525, partial [Verrucomicrobiota bacterium]
RIDAVEINPDVVERLDHFKTINNLIHEDPRVHIHTADARGFLTRSTDPFDLIVADLFHPHKDGAAFLFTEEHFLAARNRLSDRGVMVQWLPLYQMSPDTLKIILRTFLKVYPDAHAFIGIYNVRMPILALVGNAGFPLKETPLKARFASIPIHQRIFENLQDLYGSFLMPPEGIETFAGPGRLNRDLHPIVLFRPRVSLADNAGPGHMAALLPARTNMPEQIVRFSDPDIGVALKQYYTAAGFFLRGEVEWALEAGARPSRSALEWFFDAYRADASFSAARGYLFNLARGHADYAEEIYPMMLKGRPDDPRVFESYLHHLRRTGQQRKFNEVKREAMRTMIDLGIMEPPDQSPNSAR